MTVTAPHPSRTGEVPIDVRIARSRDEFDAIVRIRARVFRDEQGIVGGDVTDRDEYTSVHVLAEAAGTVISAGRLSPPTSSRPEALIAWVATLPEWRGRGAGGRVVKALLDVASQQRYPNVLISAQTHALHFYERLGFRAYGERFDVKGIEHQYMEWRRPRS